jgi:hypothetical protein
MKEAPTKWEKFNKKVDQHYPRVLRVMGLASAVVGLVMTLAGAQSGTTVVGLAGTLITAGIAAESLKDKD